MTVSGNQGLTDGPYVLCDRCGSSGCIEGPEAGWYEMECPKCHGEGVISGRDTMRGQTTAASVHLGPDSPARRELEKP